MARQTGVGFVFKNFLGIFCISVLGPLIQKNFFGGNFGLVF